MVPVALANNRFECIEIAGGQGTIWDYAANGPAHLDGILIGCSEAQANAAVMLLRLTYPLWNDMGPWQIADAVLDLR